MFFDNWETIWRTILIGVLAYVILVFLLRLSGKRTLSKWNAFDFIVTIAFGSVLATTLLSGKVTIAQSVIAFAVLIFLQYIVTWLSVRVKFFRNIIKADPKLLFFEGEFLQEAMKKERVTETEVLAAMRESGRPDKEEVGAVILETDGSFSIVPKSDSGNYSSLKDVAGFNNSTNKPE